MGTFEKFAEYYDLFSQTRVNYKNECDVLEKIFETACGKKPKTILDVACGTGSHALILAERGYNVTGVDVSKVMIKKAQEKNRKEKTKADFFVQDMRNIKLDRRFDCAICMFGGFGYMLTYEDLTKLLSGLKQHLNKNGLFIFHFWNIGGVRASPYRTWIKAQDKKVTFYRLSESNFDPETSIITLDMNFIITNKNKLIEAFNELHKLRCYTPAELREYLANNRFELLSAYDWDTKNKRELKPPKKENFETLAVAKKN